ncbi:uncharacterized protein STEHIDRAFT_112388 [Stereum hirsutum FP-91666 SS1]|uniref:uncharacterized protein n=1 Tax=Stereum hirsutum (strain FP-91666) TaxID=721885 RepID=UPI000444A3E3|nr:uncharacterized protein STEHIDRAFT_112388 [Stereum hirsutum FP-91666 SS1]EIM84846.1 hypothetical protein STEHIDRAFT_112388 [Stereum hirsutum FP-91666 SS1]
MSEEREEKPHIDDKIQFGVCHQGRNCLWKDRPSNRCWLCAVAVKFKVRKTGSLKKVMNEAAKRFNVDRDHLRFEYHGVTVRGNEDDTPEALGMEEDDVIDAHLFQIGGCIMKEQSPSRSIVQL